MAELAERLNNLSGKTLGEIFHSVNLLLRDEDALVRTHLDYILKNLRTELQVQQIVKIRLIDRYQCYDEVLSVLKSDDSFYISHVLRCDWFFYKLNFDPKFLVESVFPHLSYATRHKILKKYSKFLESRETADVLFELVKHAYGVRAALILLPACSEGFIRTFLSNSFIQVPVYIIIPVFKLYPKVVIEYILHLLEAKEKKKRVLRSIDLSSYEKLFSLIASKHPSEFTSIIVKYKEFIPYLKIGKRSTRRVINTSFDLFKNNALVFKRFGCWKSVPSILNLDQLSSLQLSLFPVAPSDFFKNFSVYCDVIEIVSDLKNGKVKKEMLMKNFQQAYGKAITDYFNSFNFELVKELPQDVAQKWVQLKIPETDDPLRLGEYAAYLPQDKAIALIKKLLERQSDINLRANLIGSLFEIIIINDKPSLVGPISEYFVKRFRNERPVVKEKVIEALFNYKNLLLIPEEDWRPIEELFNIMIITDETSSCSYTFTKLLIKHIQYRLDRNLPVKDHVDKLVKFTKFTYDDHYYKNNPYEKQFLLWFLEKNSESKSSQSNNLENIFVSLCDWNQRRSKERIVPPQWLLSKIEKKLLDDEESTYSKSSIVRVMRKDAELTKIFYPKIFPKYVDRYVLSFELKHEPLVLKENVETFLPKILDDRVYQYTPFFLKARLYSPIGLPKAMTSFCLGLFEDKPCSKVEKPDKEQMEDIDNEEEMEVEDLGDDEDCDDGKKDRMKRNSILLLSIMLPSVKFKEFITKYYPTKNTIEDYSKEGRSLLEIQKEIGKNLRRVSHPIEMVEALTKFAVGDYLKLVVGSLNSIYLRVAESKVIPMLNRGLENPVSLKKHYIRLYFTISPVKDTLEMLIGLFDKEKNTSMRLLLLDNSMKFFLREPSEETYGVLKTVAEQLLPSDEEAIDKLFDIDGIPNDFLQNYLSLLWEKIAIKKETFVNKKRKKLINLIEPDIFPLLTDGFIVSLITHVLNESPIFPQEQVMFLAHSLLHSVSPELQERMLQLVKTKLTSLFLHWNSFSLTSQNVFQSRCALSVFTEALVRESLLAKHLIMSPLNLFKMVQTTLMSLAKEEDVLEELFLLEISSFYFNGEHSHRTMEEFAEHLFPIVEKRVEVFGLEVLNSVSSIVSNILQWSNLDDKDGKFFDLSEILLKKNVFNCQLLGLKMLPTSVTKNNSRFENLIKLILQVSHPHAKIVVNKFLKDLSSDVTEN